MARQDMRFDVVDYIIFALLLLFSAAIGLFYAFIDKRIHKKTDAENGIEQPKNSAKDYLLANKSMGVGHTKVLRSNKYQNMNLGFSYCDEFTC